MKHISMRLGLVIILAAVFLVGACGPSVPEKRDDKLDRIKDNADKAHRDLDRQ